jgi:hypothetical protein
VRTQVVADQPNGDTALPVQGVKEGVAGVPRKTSNLADFAGIYRRDGVLRCSPMLHVDGREQSRWRLAFVAREAAVNAHGEAA